MADQPNGGFFSHSFPKRQPEPGARVRVLVSRESRRGFDTSAGDCVSSRARATARGRGTTASRRKEQRVFIAPISGRCRKPSRPFRRRCESVGR